MQTTEEGRVDQLLFDVASQLDVPLYIWSVTVGLARMKGAPLYNTETPEQALTNIDVIHGDGIFVLKDSRDIATTTGRAGGSGSCLRNSEASGAPS